MLKNVKIYGKTHAQGQNIAYTDNYALRTHMRICLRINYGRERFRSCDYPSFNNSLL